MFLNVYRPLEVQCKSKYSKTCVPALATCETSQVLLAGVSGGFPGVLPFRPPIDWLVSMSEIILKGTLIKKRKKNLCSAATQKKTKLGFKSDNCLMQVKSIAEYSNFGAFCNTSNLHKATTYL